MKISQRRQRREIGRWELVGVRGERRKTRVTSRRIYLVEANGNQGNLEESRETRSQGIPNRDKLLFYKSVLLFYKSVLLFYKSVYRGSFMTQHIF